MNENNIYKDKYDNCKVKLSIKEEELNQVKLTRNWFIAISLILCFLLLIAIVNSGTTINNTGFTLEQVTNATIQTCNALK